MQNHRPHDTDPGINIAALDQNILRSGFLWILLSTLVLQATLGFHIATHAIDWHSTAILLVSTASASLLIALWLFLRARQPPVMLQLHISAVLLTCSWISMALTIETLWQARSAAEKMLLIAFFIMMLGWYMKLSLLACSLPFITGCYYLLLSHETGRSSIAIVISLLKFPLLLGLFLLTVRKIQLATKQAFCRNAELVHQLSIVSRTDALTQLNNRKAFNEALQAAINKARQYNQPLCLLIMDIDFFKTLNDHSGHPAGDACLQQLATVLNEITAETGNIAARIGGEEFALILPGHCTDAASQAAESFQRQLDAAGIPHPASPLSPHLTVSIGIANWHNDSFDSLYQKADKALYAAKTAGRNRYCIATGAQPDAHHPATRNGGNKHA